MHSHYTEQSVVHSAEQASRYCSMGSFQNDRNLPVPAAFAWRIVIIDPADDMNRNAANALLKTLEEPPARALFILISHSSGRLLPTIRSRCQSLAFKPLNDAELKRALDVAGKDVGVDVQDREQRWLAPVQTASCQTHAVQGCFCAVPVFCYRYLCRCKVCATIGAAIKQLGAETTA